LGPSCGRDGFESLIFEKISPMDGINPLERSPVMAIIENIWSFVSAGEDEKKPAKSQGAVGGISDGQRPPDQIGKGDLRHPLGAVG
jgi:hypothetical protein